MTVGLSAMRDFHPGATTSAIARAIDALVTEFNNHMNAMYVKVDASQDHWKGAASRAANQRALGERLAGNTLIGELDDIAEAYRKFGSAMDGYCTAAVNAADEYLRQGFDVADDGTVTAPPGMKAVFPGIVSGLSVPMTSEQLATFAVEATGRLKGLIDQFNAEDLALAETTGRELLDLVQKAAGEQGLGSWTMDTADSGNEGVQDGLLIADGKATPEQMLLIADRLREAGLTAEDIADINSGKDVRLTEAQFVYLHSFYNTAGKDGLVWMTEQMSARGDTVHAASVANGLNTLANPHVGATGTGPTGNPLPLQGGMSQIPSGIAEVLTKDYPTHQRQGGGQQIDAKELQQVSTLLAHGDASSAPGSELNRALLEKAADISVNSSATISTDHRDGGVASLVETMVETGGRDKIAVHDVLVDAGGHPRSDVIGPLLTNHRVDDGAAVQGMLSWIGEDATSSDPAVAQRAGESASGLAAYIGSHRNELLNLDGPHSLSLVEVNPRATQGIAAALSPYLADMAGVPDDQTKGTRGFKIFADTDERHESADRLSALQNIFAVVDSDKDAATLFNTRALMTSSELQAGWMQSVLDNPDEPRGELASASGTLRGLVDKGLTLELEDRGKDDKAEAARAFADKGAAYDGFKSALATGVKYVPVLKDIAPPFIDMSNTYAKNSIVGLYLPPDNPDANFQPAKEIEFGRQNYQFARVLEANGTLTHGPTYDYMFDSDGKLRDYDSLLAAKSGNSQVVTSQLLNLLNGQHDGALQNRLSDFRDLFAEGRRAAS